MIKPSLTRSQAAMAAAVGTLVAAATVEVVAVATAAGREAMEEVKAAMAVVKEVSDRTHY
jgi:hypothetical protein